MDAAARLGDAAWLRDALLQRLIAALDGDGEEARVVGGAVRNALIGEPIGDIDLATTALPEEVVRRAGEAGFRTVPTGIAHGTVTAVAEGRSFEVTTLRRDVETFGRHAKVAFGRDWEADAKRRDFTINALSATADGTVHDHVGGLADLRRRRVRFIGDAGARIAEDYLRILRFFRFHAAYGEGPPDPQGLDACIVAREGLRLLSRERVRMELIKLVTARRAVPVAAVMADTGLLIDVIGGVPDLAGLAGMAAVEAALGLQPDPVRRLGALAVRIAEDADRLASRLRLSNAEHGRLTLMAQRWWCVTPADLGEAQVMLYRLGPEHFTDRVLLAFARSRAGADDPTWTGLASLPGRWMPPEFPLKAADFIKRGVVRGPALGAALRAAEDAWIAAGFPDDPAALAAIADAAA